MNDKRFIELLNLYVDQELTDEEARTLEQEIARRPERREIYTQYCRMQRACVRLFEQQRAPQPQIEALRTAALAAEPFEAPVQVVHLPESAPRRSWRPTWAGAMWSGGLMAAAACVTFLVVRQAPQGPETSGVAVAATAVPPPAIASVVEEAPAETYRPVLVMNALLRPTGDSSHATAALPPTSLEWLHEVKLTSMRRMPFETLRFDPQGGVRSVEQAAFAVDESPAGEATEISAFQFQR